MKPIIKYTAKTPTLIGYIALVSIGLLLIIGRWYSGLNDSFVLFNAEITSHITNFTLSMLLYLMVGYFWMLMGAKFRMITVFGVVLIIANFICEVFVSYLNTLDIMDAVYGVGGVLVAFVFLYISNKYGLIENSAEKNSME